MRIDLFSCLSSVSWRGGGTSSERKSQSWCFVLPSCERHKTQTKNKPNQTKKKTTPTTTPQKIIIKQNKGQKIKTQNGRGPTEAGQIKSKAQPTAKNCNKKENKRRNINVRRVKEPTRAKIRINLQYLLHAQLAANRWCWPRKIFLIY